MVRGLELPAVLHAGLEGWGSGRIVIGRMLEIGLLPQETARPDDAHGVPQLIRPAPHELQRTGQELRVSGRDDDGEGGDAAHPERSIGDRLGLSAQRVVSTATRSSTSFRGGNRPWPTQRSRTDSTTRALVRKRRLAEIRGRAKLNSLLEGQEAVCAEVVAGGRNGWWANHSPSGSCSRCRPGGAARDGPWTGVRSPHPDGRRGTLQLQSTGPGRRTRHVSVARQSSGETRRWPSRS
jgi:hypothetical protein